MFAHIAQRMSDAAKARVRTLWPYLIGVIATWIVAKIRPAGLHLDSITAGAIVSWILGTIVYESGRWLAGRHGPGRPAAACRWAGQWLVSLGLPIQSPNYSAPAPEQPREKTPEPV
jgi:prepilin signal peptidase PulO-like enzyme (type II secretory pathway)